VQAVAGHWGGGNTRAGAEAGRSRVMSHENEFVMLRMRMTMWWLLDLDSLDFGYWHKSDAPVQVVQVVVRVQWCRGQQSRYAEMEVLRC